MSDHMLHAVLRLPPDLWSDSHLDVMQRHGRYVQASKRITDLEKACRQALEALQWNWGGEPLPTLELAAIEELKRVLAE